MTIIKCLQCDWESQDLSDAFAAVLNTQLSAHIQAAHPPPAAQPPAVQSPATPSQSHKLKLDSPKVDVDCNAEQWSSFVRQWDMYKVGMAIPDSMVNTALFYCGSEGLRLNILRDIQSDLSSLSEPMLLAAMKRLAVKEESTLAQRIKLGRMIQSPGSGIRTFLANLRGQAALCNYRAKCSVGGCSHIYDFSDAIILDTLVRGMSDHEIMSDLLGDTKTDRTLEETVLFISQKEQGKATQSAVGGHSTMGSTTNQHQNKKSGRNKSRCWACGGNAHGQRNDRACRAEHCPAWAFTCAKCSVRGHYSSCCSKCSSCNNWGHRDSTSRFCRNNTQSGKGQSDSNSNKNGDRNNKSGDTDNPSTGALFDQLCALQLHPTSDIDDPATGALFDQLCTVQSTPTPSDIYKTYSGTGDPPSRKTDPTCSDHLCLAHTNPPLTHHIFDGQWSARN